MAHGPGPDDNRQDSSQVASMTELGEVTARLMRGLGGNYRSGRLLFMTSFQDGLVELQQRIPIGTGASIILDTTIAEFGKQSIKLTHGAAVGNKTYVMRFVPGGFGSRLGVEIGVRNLNSPMRWYLTIIGYGNGAVIDLYEWRMTVQSNHTEYAYRSGAAAWTAWSNPSVALYGPQWNNIKMIVDGATRQYGQLIVNGQQRAPAMGLAPYSGTGSANNPPFFATQVTVESMAVGNRAINLGSMVDTIDEP